MPTQTRSVEQARRVTSYLEPWGEFCAQTRRGPLSELLMTNTVFSARARARPCGGDSNRWMPEVLIPICVLGIKRRIHCALNNKAQHHHTSCGSSIYSWSPSSIKSHLLCNYLLGCLSINWLFHLQQGFLDFPTNIAVFELVSCEGLLWFYESMLMFFTKWNVPLFHFWQVSLDLCL